MSLKLENVSYIYEKGTSQETAAIKNVDLEINKGEFVAIIGHTRLRKVNFDTAF